MKTILKTTGIALIAFGLTACQKENKENLDAFDDIVNTELEQRDFEIEDDLGSQECTTHDFSTHLPDGVNVIDTIEGYPKTIVLDYGEGVEDNHGRIKSGKVIITLTGDLRESGSIKTITLEDFTVGDANVEGTRTIENLGENENGNIELAITGEMTGTKGDRTRVKSFERVREWVAGFETCERGDDEFLITGSSIVTAGPRSISTKITIAIHKTPGTCEYPLAGEIQITKGNGKTGVLNFGNGTCDSEATLTLDNGDVKEVDLENRRCRR